MRLRGVWALLTIALALSAATGSCQRPSVEEAPPPAQTASMVQEAPPAATVVRPIALPADDAPHADATTEWWYYNGHLTTEDGAEYSFHFALFVVTAPAPGRLRAVLAHAAVTDHLSRVQSQAERGRFGVVRTVRGGFVAELDDWRTAGGNGNDTLLFNTRRHSVDLRATARKKPVLHNTSGWVEYPDGMVSAYYSRTRMDIVGTITGNAMPVRVTGEAWFDHQWGNFDARGAVWDWFALQFDDGQDVMLSLVRNLSGRQVDTYGTLSAPDGANKHLILDDFSVEALGSWTSPASGATYPVGWRVRLGSAAIDAVLTPVLEASEFDARRTTGNFYWEGAVKVSGSRAGRGFVEMAGYALTVPVTQPSRSVP